MQITRLKSEEVLFPPPSKYASRVDTQSPPARIWYSKRRAGAGKLIARSEQTCSRRVNTIEVFPDTKLSSITVWFYVDAAVSRCSAQLGADHG